MTPTEAAKVMGTWGETLTGAAHNLAKLANVSEVCTALELRRNELDVDLKRIVGELQATRAAHASAKAEHEAETRELVQQRKDALFALEATHKRRLTDAELNSNEAIIRAEEQRDKLKTEIAELAAQKASLSGDVESLRSIIAEMAKK